MIEFGRAKHFSKVTLRDHQKHLIWTSAHDDRHDKQWEKPIISSSEVTQEIIDSSLVVPIITVRVEGTDTLGTSWYSHRDRELFAIAVWHEDQWKDLIYGRVLRPPSVFVSIPKILGDESVRFMWNSSEHDKAFRIA